MLDAKLLRYAEESEKRIVQKQCNQQKAKRTLADGAAGPKSNSGMLHHLHSSTNIV
jgi:hypothetical protein